MRFGRPGGGRCRRGRLSAFTLSGIADALREVPLWASWAANRPQYYLIMIARDAPLLWPLFPVAALAAFFANRRLTVFCVVAFAVALAVHSAAASKQLRYVYYALPFLCVIWGCALSGLYSFVTRAELRSRRFGNGTAAPFALFLAAVVLALSQEGQQRRAARARSPRDRPDGESTTAKPIGARQSPSCSRSCRLPIESLRRTR